MGPERPAAGPRGPYLALVATVFLSITGTAVSAVALPWLVLTSTGSASSMGLVAFAEMAPFVVLQAVGGPLVDRLGGHRVATLLNLLAAGVLAGVAVLGAAGLLPLAVLVALVAVVGAARGMAENATAVLVPAAARHAGLAYERAAGVVTSANRAGYLAGAPAAGVLLVVLDPAMVLAITAAALALAAVLVGYAGGAVRGEHRAPGREAVAESSGYLVRLRAGYRFLARDRVLRALVLLIAVSNLLSSATTAVYLPVWAGDHDLPVVVVGVVLGATGLGALAGNLVAAWLGPRLPRRATLLIGLVIGPIPLPVVLAATSSSWLPVCVAVLTGLASGGVNPVVGALQYERIPQPLLARVLGAVKASAWLGIPLGPVLGGLLVGATGVTTALWLSAGLGTAAALAAVLARGLRDLASPRDAQMEWASGSSGLRQPFVRTSTGSTEQQQATSTVRAAQRQYWGRHRR